MRSDRFTLMLSYVLTLALGKIISLESFALCYFLEQPGKKVYGCSTLALFQKSNLQIQFKKLFGFFFVNYTEIMSGTTSSFKFGVI